MTDDKAIANLHATVCLALQEADRLRLAGVGIALDKARVELEALAARTRSASSPVLTLQ
jgi:hypothetical protein